MNVYIYQGLSRRGAYHSLVANNSMPEVGQNYTVPYDAGILVVVYPKKEQISEFAFKYWISDEPIKVIEIVNNTNSTDNDTIREFDVTQFTNTSIV